MMDHIQYPAVAEPVFTPGEDITVDKWFHPLEEPIREVPIVPAALMPFRSLMDPVAKLESDRMRWFPPMSEPVRETPIIPASLMPFYWLDQEAKRELDIMRWFAPLNEPVRETPFSLAAILPGWNTDHNIPVVPPDVSLFRWYRPFDEPIREIPRSEAALIASGYTHRNICFSVLATIQSDADDGSHTDHTYNTAISFIGNSGGINRDLHKRFDSLLVPQRANITFAQMRFHSDTAESLLNILTDIRGQIADDPAAVTNETEWHDAVDDNLTVAIVAWDNIPAWSIDEFGPDTFTPDLSSIIQEIVNRSTFTQGDAVQLFIIDTGSDSNHRRRIENGPGAQASELLVEFCLADAGFPFDPAANMAWFRPASEPVRVEEPLPRSEAALIASGYTHRNICFTIRVEVAANDDDGRFNSSPNWNTSILSVGLSVDTFSASIRFLGLSALKAATILSAKIIFESRSNIATTVMRTVIRGHDADNSGQITSVATWEAIVPSQLTAATVTWDDIPAWSGNERGPDTTTPDISAVIQEIVDRAGFGSVLHLFHLDDGSDAGTLRLAYAFEGAGEPAELVVSFCLPDAGFPFDPAANMAWFRPASEPVLVQEPLNAALRYWIIDRFQLTLPERTQLDKWYFPLGEPVREVPIALAALIPAWFIDANIAAVPDEVITMDKWYRPASEPVRVKEPLNAAILYWIIDRFQLTLPEATLLAKWYAPLGEPVREVPLSLAALLPGWVFDFTEIIAAEVITMDKWYRPASEPVRVEPPLPIGAKPYYWMDQLAKLEPEILRWFRAPDEPVRETPIVPAALMPHFWIDPEAKLEPDRLRWFRMPDEPVRETPIVPAALMPSWEIDRFQFTLPEVTLMSKWYRPFNEPPAYLLAPRSEAALIASGLYLQGPTVFITIGKLEGTFTLFAAVDGSHTLGVAVEGTPGLTPLVDGTPDIEDC